MKFGLITIIILLAISPALFAQKVQRVSGEYVYYAPPNVTVEQARQTAIDKAKIEIISQNFGLSEILG